MKATSTRGGWSLLFFVPFLMAMTGEMGTAVGTAFATALAVGGIAAVLVTRDEGRAWMIGAGLFAGGGLLGIVAAVIYLIGLHQLEHSAEQPYGQLRYAIAKEGVDLTLAVSELQSYLIFFALFCSVYCVIGVVVFLQRRGVRAYRAQ